MKAEIDEKGKLSIVAETKLESFALNQWFMDYNNSYEESSNRFAVLEVITRLDCE